MIDVKYCKDANIDKDCVDIFNESSISYNGNRWIFKPKVYEMLTDCVVEEKFAKVYPEKKKKLRYLMKRFNNEEYTFHKSDMVEFVNIVEEYFSFGIKADKMVQIHERMKDLEKDFK